MNCEPNRETNGATMDTPVAVTPEPCQTAGGIECRHCHAVGQWKVTHTRDVPGAIRRRRVCLACDRPETTIEVAVREFHAISSMTSENPSE